MPTSTPPPLLTPPEKSQTISEHSVSIIITSSATWADDRIGAESMSKLKESKQPNIGLSMKYKMYFLMEFWIAIDRPKQRIFWLYSSSNLLGSSNPGWTFCCWKMVREIAKHLEDVRTNSHPMLSCKAGFPQKILCLRKTTESWQSTSVAFL